MVTTHRTRDEAKAELRRVLAASGGNTQREDVVAAIEALSHLNLSAAPADEDTLLEGNWILISAPNFPGKLQRADGQYAYTLGRLAFNMFPPTDLEVVIDKVSQPVLPVGKGRERTHDIVVEFSTVGEGRPRLEGIVRNLGMCTPKDKTHLQVWFTGGSLSPKATTDLDDWRTVFGRPSHPSKPPFSERLQSFLLRVMFGISPASDVNPATGEQTFEMKRSPKGSLELIYLDEDLRITKGDKGTVLVCEREPS